MDIGTAVRELGTVNIQALEAAILSQEEAAWREEALRQEAYEVHRQTQSIVLVFTDGDGWPDIEVRKAPGWERLAAAAVPVMHDIIGRWYPRGGSIVRAMAAKLPRGGRIAPHRDAHPSFHCGHRIHVPIATNSRVRMIVDGRPYRLQKGRAYELNNQLMHSVANKGGEDRITFIFDYVPPGRRAEAEEGKGRDGGMAAGL